MNALSKFPDYFLPTCLNLFDKYFLMFQSSKIKFPQISWQERFSMKFPVGKGFSDKFPGSSAATATDFVLFWGYPISIIIKAG